MSGCAELPQVAALDALPFGRWIGDFLSHGELPEPEIQLLIAAVRGEVAVFGENCPERETPDRQVRAALLRFLLLGGDAAAPTHELGILIYGAWIAGELDLCSARNVRAFRSVACDFDTAPAFQFAELSIAGFNGASLPGIKGDRSEVRGGIFLRTAKCTGEIRLNGVNIDGNLDCDGVILSSNEYALNADGLTVSGSVFLRGVTATGEIRLLGLKAGGNIECERALLLAGKTGCALQVERADIGGSVFSARVGPQWVGLPLDTRLLRTCWIYEDCKQERTRRASFLTSGLRAQVPWSMTRRTGPASNTV